MEETASTFNLTETDAPPWGKIGLLLLLIVPLLFAGGLYAYQTYVPQPVEEPGVLTSKAISAADLEALHGVKVHLIGVTAAGGMIDFRLKITDPVKARRLLENPANLPIIIVAESGYQLMSPEGLDDEIEWTDGGILFNFYPNDGGFIQAGTPVIVRFGDIHLETQAQ